jgi:hypothetical protein
VSSINDTAAPAGAVSRYRLQHRVTAFMLALIGRLLAAASEVDPTIRGEVSAMPPGQTFLLGVRPAGPALIISEHDGRLRPVAAVPDGAPLAAFEFKHIEHAFLAMTFQESTPQSFANDRMVFEGDIAMAMKFVRCLTRMETLILPKIIARLAVKTYPENLRFGEKLGTGSRIYLRLVRNLFIRS